MERIFVYEILNAFRLLLIQYLRFLRATRNNFRTNSQMIYLIFTCS